MENTKFYANIKSHLGEDDTKTHAWYGMGGAWCCMFVTKNFNETGNKSMWYGGKKVCYCPTAITWCKANWAKLPLYLAMPADVIFFDWNNNNTPDHIGFVRERVSTSTIKTIEGNTGSPAKVREKERPACYVLGVFRPPFKPDTLPTDGKLTCSGKFGYKSIWMLQKALGIKQTAIFDKKTVKALQKAAGATADGDWGEKTSKAIQKMVGVEVDGEFGIKSVKGLQKWINKKVYP